MKYFKILIKSNIHINKLSKKTLNFIVFYNEKFIKIGENQLL